MLLEPKTTVSTKINTMIFRLPEEFEYPSILNLD